MGRVRTGIGGGLGLHADREIPGRQGGVRRREATDRRPFKLAVIVTTGRADALRRQCGEENLRRTGRRRLGLRAGLTSIAERCARCLRHLKDAVAIERGRHVVPSPFQQATGNFRSHTRTDRRGDLSHRTAITTDAESQRPETDAQCDQTLPAFARRGRPDRCGQTHTAPQIGRQRRNMAVAAEPGGLFLPRLHAVYRGRHRNLGISRAGRVGVGADVTNEAQCEVASAGAGDHEANCLTLLDAPAIGITGQRVHRGQVFVTS